MAAGASLPVVRSEGWEPARHGSDREVIERELVHGGEARARLALQHLRIDGTGLACAGPEISPMVRGLHGEGHLPPRIHICTWLGRLAIDTIAPTELVRYRVKKQGTLRPRSAFVRRSFTSISMLWPWGP